MEKFEIAVIGGGAAGTMAYLRAVLNFDRTVFFTGNALAKKRSRGTWVSEVDNMPGFHDMKNPITKTTSSTLRWIQSQKKISENGKVFRSSVTGLEKSKDGFLLSFEEKQETKQVWAKFVIVATGVMDTQPLINGSIEPIFPFANRNDVLYCIRCDGHRVAGHSLSIIGHTDPAIYIGAILKERYDNQHVFILTNGATPSFSQEATQLAMDYQFIIYTDAIEEVLGNPGDKGLEGYRLTSGKSIHTTRSVVSLGYIPYNDLLQQVGATIEENGRINVDSTFETSIPNLFAVGDLVANRKMQIYTAWDEAVDAADEINRRIRRQKRKKILENF